MLGDEYTAQQQKHDDRETELYWYRRAVRANRQLATVLRTQGLNEEADRFAYRAQLLQRKVLWHQHEFGRWLFSILLAILSGLWLSNMEHSRCLCCADFGVRSGLLCPWDALPTPYAPRSGLS